MKSRPLPTLLALAAFAAGATAAAPVEESRATGAVVTQEPAYGSTQQGSTSTGRLTDLYYQLQVLQGEVQTLRGLVEEQQHLIDRLRKDQREQYIDLDGRVAALTRGGPQAPAATDQAEPAPSVTATSGPEKTAYTAAFNLMKSRQFDASIDEFNRFVLDFPNGEYTPNAFYWLGELHLAKNQDEFARQSFAQVINLYPDHNKIPDALYKLGVVYHRLGDRHRALEYLNRVRAEHPDSSAATLAETYAQEML